MDQLRHRFPVYSKLLALYPAEYRREYGEQMLQTLADMLDDPELHRASVWVRTCIDFPLSVSKQQLTYTGAAMSSIPPYINHYARIGVWMCTPFFLLVILNGLSNQWLRHTIVWSPSWLYTWMVLLPGIAVLLNLTSLLRWVQKQRQEHHTSIGDALFDLRQNWPAVATIVLGVGIFAIIFWHDSAHCITGNPIRELQSAHQTLHCIQQR